MDYTFMCIIDPAYVKIQYFVNNKNKAVTQSAFNTYRYTCTGIRTSYQSANQRQKKA